MLTTQELKAAAPAAFARSHHMSDRYSMIRTDKVISALSDVGYVPVQAQQDAPRRRPITQVTHRIVLRHQDNIATVGDTVPQIMLVNSHNGRTMMRLFAGLYRFVCANGLVVGNHKFIGAVKHYGTAVEDALRYAEQMTQQVGQLNTAIDAWSKIELSDGKVVDFAKAAAKLRYGERADAYDPRSLLEARREEDEGRTLWTVYNRIQEVTTKGGAEGFSATGRRMRSRPLTQINADINYNSALWNLAESYAEAA